MSLIEFEVSHCDDSLMSVVSSDGTLRVIQIGLLREESDRKHKGKKSEKSKKSKRKGGTSEEESDEDTRGYSVVLAQRSFFGAFLCVKWSPDDRFVVTGGEDDLVSLWSVEHKCLLARFEGHLSYVSSVCFDALLCTSERVRIASVGQDTRVYLWDYYIDTEKPLRDCSTEELNEMCQSVPMRHTPLLVRPIGGDSFGREPLTDILCTSQAILVANYIGEVFCYFRP